MYIWIFLSLNEVYDPPNEDFDNMDRQSTTINNFTTISHSIEIALMCWTYMSYSTFSIFNLNLKKSLMTYLTLFNCKISHYILVFNRF